MENQHRLIKGYRELSQQDIDRMNTLKEMEAGAIEFLDLLSMTDEVNKRWLAIAKTHIQQGFMAAGRAVARPTE